MAAQMPGAHDPAMLVERRETRRSEAGLAIGVVLLLLAAVLVMMLGRSGALSRLVPVAAGPAPPLPGLTVDDRADAMPVVTSLRSDSEAQRRGVEVGDRIVAVDRRIVRDVADLRAAVAAHGGAMPVSLLIRRGNTIWDVALDRTDPADAIPEHGATFNDPEDPARRGR